MLEWVPASSRMPPAGIRTWALQRRTPFDSVRVAAQIHSLCRSGLRDGNDASGGVFALLLQQLGYQAGPAGLVTGAEPGARVAVEILEKQHIIAPKRIVLQQLVVAPHRASSGAVAHKDTGQAPRQLVGDLGEGQIYARPGRAFDSKIVAVVMKKLLQRLDQ